MPTKETPSYSSSRVQRATRINSIEAARLQQRLRYIEQAKLHQSRLTNQDIRLISISIDYIQASSGHSPEAWRPEPKVQEKAEPEEQGPCFLYGERIWSRKKRRIQRPMSAFERSGRGIDSESTEGEESITSQRPQSSPVKCHRPMTAVGYFTPNPGVDSGLDISGTSDVDGEIDRLSSRGSTPRDGVTPRGRVTPHQDWEDDTSDITKKILKAQARAQSGKQRSLYQSPEDAMNMQSFKNVRGLIRKIRISATPVTAEAEGHPPRPTTPFDKEQPPHRPGMAGNGLGRRPTFGEILNQRRPTLSAGAWRSHLNQTSATPMSMSAHREKVLSARKELNDTRTAIVNEKVKDFIKNTPRANRPKSALR